MNQPFSCLEFFTRMLNTLPSPFRSEDKMLSLLIFEDITGLLRLRSLLPARAWCKKIRIGNNYGQSLEEHFSDHLDLECSHSLCDESCKKHIPDLAS